VTKCGQPLLLGDTLDSEVKFYIRGVHEGGGLVTMEITMAVARAITGEEGPIAITSNWVKSLLNRMKFVKRRGNTTTG